MLHPIPLSVRSTMKLWLQSKTLSQTSSLRTHSPSETRRTDSWLICTLVSYALPSSPHPQDRKAENGTILVQSSSCVRVRVDFFFTCIFHILSTYQFITRYELKSSITYQCGTYRMYVFHVTVCWCVWFGGRLMCLSPLCCFPSFVSCCCLDRPRLAGDRNKWDC